jgi:hypothetical protein
MVGYSSVYGEADPFAMAGPMSMGAPTVNTTAAVNNAGMAPVSTGIASPTVTGSPGVAGAAPTVAGAAAPAGGGPGFFAPGGGAQFALGAIQTLGSLWSSFQQNKLAKESFNFQKEAYYTNLANQEKTYNTALEDRISTRYQGSGGSAADRDAEIAKKSL